MPFRTIALAVLCLALMSTSASAQTASTDQTCLVGGQPGAGRTQIATNCPIGRAPALSEFRFGFLNSDHRFRAVTLLPAGESFEAAWADVGGEDPFFAEARWLRVPEAQGGVVEALVRGIADIPIPPGPANTTLVLSGFEFQREDGTDANIRTIALQTDSARATIRTVLLDDQNMNFEQLAAAVGIGFAIGATGVPDPSISLAATSSSNMLMTHFGSRSVATSGSANYTFIPPENNPTMATSGVRPGQIEISSTSARPYRVKVAYLWVPNARLANTRMVSGADRSAATTSGRLPRETPHVLHGFSFHFANSDHFIGGFGVHLSGGAPVQNAVNPAEVVTWEDNNRDDPIQWTARFSELVGSSPAPAAAAARVINVAPMTPRMITPVTPAPSTSSPPSTTPAAEDPPAEEPAPEPRGRRPRRG